MSTTSAMPGTPRVWTGAALVVATAGFLVIEAVVAAAWDLRPYSYADDYVNFLGSRFVGEYEGYTISSPLWLLMDVGWVLTGLLMAAATARLARALPGWRRRLTIILAVTLALALVVFAAFPLGPQTVAAGLLPVYLAGAFLSIIAGNGLAIILSAVSEPLGLPRPVRITGLALGVLGLVSIPATYGWLAIGVAERIPLYSFLAWAAVTGVALLLSRPQPEPLSGSGPSAAAAP